MPTETPRRFRIMSMDGGISPATNLRMLHSVAKDLRDQGKPGMLASTDMFAGNSAGALAVLHLANQIDQDPGGDEVEMFERSIKFFTKVVKVLNGGPKAVGNLILGREAAIDTEDLHKLLEDEFGDKRLSELNKLTSIATYELRVPSHPQMLGTCTYPTTHPDAPSIQDDLTLVNAGMRSSAYPLFYPLYQSSVDGAMVSNNPSMLAVAQAMQASRTGSDPRVKGIALDEIVLFSLGTDFPEFMGETLPTSNESWGWMKWLGPNFGDWLKHSPSELVKEIKEAIDEKNSGIELMLLMSALVYGNSQGVRRQCRQLLAPDNFFRLAIAEQKSIGEDVLYITIGLGPILIPLAESLAFKWSHNQLEPSPHHPTISDTLSWLGSHWCL